MKITRTSMLSGVTRTVDLPVTEEQLDRWRKGELIQNVFPDLTPGQREFLNTGCVCKEWDEAFAAVEDKLAEDAYDELGFRKTISRTHDK